MRPIFAVPPNVAMCHKLPRRSQPLTTPAQNCGTGQIRYSFVFVGKAGARLLGMARN
jgi:hypothetical protein